MDARCGAPRVWIVEPYRAGERGQTLALAEALGWSFETKSLRYRQLAARTNLLRGSDLSGIVAEDRRLLAPPWPDLVISAGMRNEPVCRWIRAQSGGRTRIVHIGKPWADPHRFDLVITTPQYRFPHRDNVLVNDLTLHRVSPERLHAAAAEWKPRLDGLPAPYLTVVLGGHSGPYTFGVHAARRLVRQLEPLAQRLGASLLITTSARTDATAVDALQAELGRPHQLYRWKPADAANPYFAYLGLAAEIVVTADSISMISEACATGRPVHLFDLNVGALAMHESAARGPNDDRLAARLYRLLMRFGPRYFSRDLRNIHRRVVESGQAGWLEYGAVPRTPQPGQDLERAVRRVRELFSN